MDSEDIPEIEVLKWKAALTQMKNEKAAEENQITIEMSNGDSTIFSAQ